MDLWEVLAEFFAVLLHHAASDNDFSALLFLFEELVDHTDPLLPRGLKEAASIDDEIIRLLKMGSVLVSCLEQDAIITSLSTRVPGRSRGK